MATIVINLSLMTVAQASENLKKEPIPKNIENLWNVLEGDEWGAKLIYSARGDDLVLEAKDALRAAVEHDWDLKEYQRFLDRLFGMFEDAKGIELAQIFAFEFNEHIDFCQFKWLDEENGIHGPIAEMVQKGLGGEDEKLAALGEGRLTENEARQCLTVLSLDGEKRAAFRDLFPVAYGHYFDMEGNLRHPFVLLP